MSITVKDFMELMIGVTSYTFNYKGKDYPLKLLDNGRWNVPNEFETFIITQVIATGGWDYEVDLVLFVEEP